MLVMEQNQLYTIPEVADILSVSVSQIYRYTKQEENPLPVIHLGEKTPRIRREDLDKWIASQTSDPN